MKLYIKKFFKIDPLKSYIELPLFQITLTTAILLALITTVLIISNSDLQWKFDYVGFNSFVEIFRVPLSVMAIAITIIAILATMHRSAQTREQIIITNTQNVFSNYYKHIEEFEKYLNSAIKSKNLIFENLRLAHKCLFPNSFQGNYNVDKGYLGIIEKEYAQIKNLLNNFNCDRKETVHNLLFGIYEGIDNCFSYLYIRIRRDGTRRFENGKLFVVPSDNIVNIINDIKNTSLILIHILAFDREVKIPKSIKQVSSLIISQVPEWNFDSKQKFENFILFNEQQ
jgi:hypothetical protein